MKLAMALLLGATAMSVAWCRSAEARVVRVVVETRVPIAGAYERLSGRYFGEIDPRNPRNAAITDLRYAPRNARGLVEYSATFSLARPLVLAKASGVLIPIEDYTYSGETRTNWALTVSDPKNIWDLAGAGKLMLRTRNSGYCFTHLVIKTADGKYFASEEGPGESSVWMNVEYVFSDLHWRSLLMTDTPTNASNRRAPDPKLAPIIPQARATPDLTHVQEVGFSDLMPGGWIPSTTRVNALALYGKKNRR